MKWFSIFICFLLSSPHSFSQGSPPWERPLMICFSNNGITFAPPVIFQDSSGVPSVCRDSSGKLTVAFQWFPAPMNGPHWDSVAVKFSFDNGLIWTPPQSITVQNLPVNFQRPFDPTVVSLPGGLIRIYFSSGPPGINTVATYSAIGTDGVNYTFEPGIRFSQPGRNIIDPSVILFNGQFQYTAPVGVPQDGAFHATSADGLTFLQQTDIASDSSHQWTGNFMVDSLALKYYGTGAMGTNIWMRSTPDGIAWDPYITTNIAGGDPAIVKINGGLYVMIFTGMSLPSAITDVPVTDDASVYPSPASTRLFISAPRINHLSQMKIFDSMGNEVKQKIIDRTKEAMEIDVAQLTSGIYFLRIESDDIIFIKKFSVVR